MKTVEAPSGTCQIAVGESVGRLPEYAGAGRVILVVDANVLRLHGNALRDYQVIEVEAGEESKNLQTVERVYERFLELELDRSSFVVGVGGGMVTDVTGFAASTYLRGLPFGFVPTTLLAMVDASIGGKNGVSFKRYKNLIGVIRQPRFCLCDMHFLKTLPQRELACGFAEVVKSAAIADADLFELLEREAERALRMELNLLEKIVDGAMSVKVDIVRRDEVEGWERMKLNFGHTIGHAVEKVAGLAHGEAVSIGMVVAARLSVEKRMLASADSDRIVRLLPRFGLPTNINADPDAMIDAIKKDKKRAGDKIRMVLLEAIGRASIREVSLDELRGVVKGLS